MNLDLLVDLHASNHRQGPGSTADTLLALSFIELPTDRPLEIADLGCGTGASTLVLAENTDSHIQAVDLFDRFTDQLAHRADEAQINDRITIGNYSMDDLPFNPNSLDLIWSEGAIYNIGFEKGLRYWRSFLKPEGYLAVSEITWLTNERPSVIESFWNEEYPEIGTASEKIRTLERTGYRLCGYFTLPETSWTAEYFNPIEASFDSFLERHLHSVEARAMVEIQREEIRQYREFKAYFSYGFYIAKRV